MQAYTCGGYSYGSRFGEPTFCLHIRLRIKIPLDVSKVQFADVGDTSHIVTNTRLDANIGTMWPWLIRSPIDKASSDDSPSLSYGRTTTYNCIVLALMQSLNQLWQTRVFICIWHLDLTFAARFSKIHQIWVICSKTRHLQTKSDYFWTDVYKKLPNMNQMEIKRHGNCIDIRNISLDNTVLETIVLTTAVSSPTKPDCDTSIPWTNVGSNDPG